MSEDNEDFLDEELLDPTVLIILILMKKIKDYMSTLISLLTKAGTFKNR
jgi:hypothetical protein